jgi:D-proline reductase (dithiol) PrdB
LAYLQDIPPRTRGSVEKLPCPEFETANFVAGKPLGERRIAVVSTAGLHKRGGRLFNLGASDFRVVPNDTPANDIVMSHVSINYDRTGYLQDINVALPLDRLAEMADAGEIGSVAKDHYAFMGATDPTQMQDHAAQIAGMLKADQVDAVLLVPV